MKEQRSKLFVKGFISTEMPIVFMVTNYMWKLLKVWKLWYPLEGPGVPHHFRQNNLAPLKHHSVLGQLLLKGTLWAVARRAAGAEQPYRYCGACVTTGSQSLTPQIGSQSKAWHCKGIWRQPELRHVLGAVRSGVSQPCVCHQCPALRHGCASQRLMGNSPCSCTYFVSPHIRSHCVCHRSRDCSVCVETRNFLWLCRGSLCLSKLRTQVSSGVVPGSAIIYTIHKKNIIRFYPCSTWYIFWIWKGKPKKCIWEKVVFSLNGVNKWGTKRFGVAKMIFRCTWVIFLENVLPFQVCVLRLWYRGTVCLRNKQTKKNQVCF